jgi:hypothetical protein
LQSESVIKKIKDSMKDVDEFLTASSGNGSFEGHKAQTNTEQNRWESFQHDIALRTGSCDFIVS